MDKYDQEPIKVKFNWTILNKFLAIVLPIFTGVLIIILVFMKNPFLDPRPWGYTTVVFSVWFFIYFIALLIEIDYFRKKKRVFRTIWYTFMFGSVIQSIIFGSLLGRFKGPLILDLIILICVIIGEIDLRL
ncbi:MAG: hypothetical protein ACTSU2_06200 [Promethearchaeota archaeon]